MQKLVSIIVPVYNVEKYIDKCVRSLLKQDYGNIEVILVDDGSPDKSGYIIDLRRLQKLWGGIRNNVIIKKPAYILVPITGGAFA